MVAYFVEKELDRRKQLGEYKGKFATVTHFFGYQGRAAHPSTFDCSLGSTSGYGAACLLNAGITNVAVSVKDITNSPDKWRVGGVPILALLDSHPKLGYSINELIVPSQGIKLDDIPYQKFKAAERSWRLIDHYCNPGPI